MAFAGFHVAFGYAGAYTGSAPTPLGRISLPVMGTIERAETMTVAGTSTIVSPERRSDGSDVIMVVTAADDSWFTIGGEGGTTPADPSSTSAARELIYGGERLERIVPPGRKVRWTTA